MNSFSFIIADDFIKREINSFERNFPIILEGITAENFMQVKEKILSQFGENCQCVLVDNESGKMTEVLAKDLNCVERLIIKAANFLSRDYYTFGDLIEIIRRLRDPDGCHWDKVQTHKSIKPNAIEEAFELAEAIDLNNIGKMIEESGDVMLQGLFHATIAEDAKTFTTNDVINALCIKLITRHPHVFADNKAGNPEEALKSWEKAKAKEKGQKSFLDKIESVPVTFGSLMRARKVDSIIRKYGFDFTNLDSAAAKIPEEFEELKEAKTQKEKEWEGGDLLFAVMSYLVKIGVDPESALNATTNRFIKRFAYVIEMSKEKGFELKAENIDIMEKYYQESKKFEDN
ncbi:MAG TPA: nucleoside triphosphate pyrophosphohydrolase [Clostridia bacterium]|jgi:tetrapyrrole methylase family protein/MazG family protein|nr:nucleoside triphosphate pyrophosphohydrolase [Clostridia bacterium]